MNNLVDPITGDNNSEDDEVQDLFDVASSPQREQEQMAKDEEDEADLNQHEANQIVDKDKERIDEHDNILRKETAFMTRKFEQEK